MLRLVILVLLGTFFSLAVARPAAPTSKTKVRFPVPTKYAACKANDCPPFRVVEKIAPDVELREYNSAWWANTKEQVSQTDNKVTRQMYWRLRSYLARNNKQNRYIRMAAPVTKLFEISPLGKISFITMSFYLPIPNPPQPKFNMVWLTKKPIHVYVKIFKKLPYRPGITKSHADNLTDVLISHGYDGTFYPPNIKYISVGYDSPFVPQQNRTNEVWLIKKPQGFN